MEEKDMLPDGADQVPEESPKPEEDVKETATEPKEEIEVKQEASTEEIPQPKGSKTPENLLYKSLREERQKRKDLEKRLKALEEAAAPKEYVEETEAELDESDDRYSDLQKEVDELKKEKIFDKNPELNDKREELEEYLEDNPNLTTDQAITLFRAEQGLGQTERKGLEKTTSGPKEAPKPKWSNKEIDEMRVNNPRKWEKLVDEGVFDDVSW